MKAVMIGACLGAVIGIGLVLYADATGGSVLAATIVGILLVYGGAVVGAVLES